MLLAPLLLAQALLSTGSPPALPSVAVFPARARPGDAFLVVVRGAPVPPAAHVAGRDLHFFPVPEGFAAIGGLPVETPAGKLVVAVALPAAQDAAPAALEGALEIATGDFPHRRLAVEQQFVDQPPPELQRRIDEDRAAFARAYERPPAPPLFAAPFAWPRDARVTARFGEQRTLNGVKPSQHYGLDLSGRLGDPVTAANAGEVVLVRDCWASGRTVLLWHGAGLFTAYFHLSRTLVEEGARVTRGQRVGLVGRSGRAAGPHLHWSVRVGDLYVDPESVLRLPLASWR